jgi:hypothetical protein
MAPDAIEPNYQTIHKTKHGKNLRKKGIIKLVFAGCNDYPKKTPRRGKQLGSLRLRND